MTVVGFTLDPKDPTKRIPHDYNSHQERAWCECGELADAKLWEEAEAKLDEYYDLSGGFVRYSRDALLSAQVAVGLAGVKGGEENYVAGAKQALSFALFKDDGSESEKIADMINDLSEAQCKHTIPAEENEGEAVPVGCLAYQKASRESLVEAATLLLELFTLADENNLDIETYSTGPHNTFQCLIDALLDKDPKKASKFIEKVLHLEYCSNFFKDCEENWNKELTKHGVSLKTIRSPPDELSGCDSYSDDSLE